MENPGLRCGLYGQGVALYDQRLLPNVRLAKFLRWWLKQKLCSVQKRRKARPGCAHKRFRPPVDKSLRAIMYRLDCIEPIAACDSAYTPMIGSTNNATNNPQAIAPMAKTL